MTPFVAHSSPNVSRPLHSAALATCLLTLSACGWVFDGEPDGLRRGREGKDNAPGSCPRVDGAYRNNGSDLAAVVTRLAGTGMQLHEWETVAITGHPDVAVQLVIQRTDRSADTVTIERDRGYDCDAGWFHPRRAAGLMDDIKAPGRDSPNAREPDERTHRYEFHITSDDKGQLVGRLEDINFSNFWVWCGDGCKGLPLPWSIRRNVWWSFLPDSSVPVVTPGPRTPQDERLLAEERAQENGPGLTPIEGWVDRAVRGAVRSPASILGTGPNPEGLHVSILVPDSTWVPQVVERFRGLAGVRGAREARLYASFDEARRWHTVVYVVPDTAFIQAALRR